MWRAWTGVGLESCRLTVTATGVEAEGVALGLKEDRPWAVHYTVRCDAGWRARELAVQSLAGDGGTLVLTGDGIGGWADGRGQRLPALDGCLDVDLMCTPFTNTLPIRRLRLPVGASAEIVTAYVGLDLTVQPDGQRYTRLDERRYRYEALDGDFEREIEVDGAGLVVDYPGLFARA